MKLTDLKPSVASMEVVHPTMGATGVTLRLVGQDTKQFRDKAKQIAKSVVGKGTKDVDLDAMQDQNLELVACCIVGWSGLEDDDGAELEYTPERALELIRNPELSFIKEQVEEFVADRKNFFRPARA